MSTQSPSTFGLVCALEGELGGLASRRIGTRRALGLEVAVLACEGARVLAVVSGIGKVRAAHAASALIAAGVDRALLVVGTCGALVRGLGPGDLVHCASALDHATGTRHDRESHSDPRLRAAWQEIVPGPDVRFFTVDKPVLSHFRRAHLARSRPGPSTVDMETAAAALVADAAGIPWAALRVVTDRAGFGAAQSFRQHFAAYGGRPADTVPILLGRLG